MPTYEYRCPEGHDFEKFFRTISAAAPTLPCPRCGAEGVRQLSAGAGLMFKGSGFYLTDYGRNAHAPKPPVKGEGTGGDAKAASEKPAGEKPAGDKAAGDKAAGDRPAAAGGEKPASASRPSKPAAKKPAE